MGPARAHFEAAYSGDITLKYDGNVNQVYLLSANRDEGGELITNDSGYVSEELSWVALQNEQGEEGVGRYSVTFLLANTNKANAQIVVDRLLERGFSTSILEVQPE